MSDPAGSGRRSSGGASNFFPNLLSEILSDMTDRADPSYRAGNPDSEPYSDISDSDSDTLSSGWSAPVSDNREDDFDMYVDSNVGDGYYVALFLQQILAR